MSQSQSLRTINQPDVILNQGQAAPAIGVWVNPDKYRLYTIDSLENKQLHAKLDEYLKNPPPQVLSDSLGSKLQWFGAGAILGLLTVLIVR